MGGKTRRRAGKADFQIVTFVLFHKIPFALFHDYFSSSATAFVRLLTVWVKCRKWTRRRGRRFAQQQIHQP
jgi:hypothetical protein